MATRKLNVNQKVYSKLQVISLSRRISVLEKVYDAARKVLKPCIEHDCLGGRFNGCRHSGKDCTSRAVLTAVQEAEAELSELSTKFNKKPTPFSQS